MFKLSIKIILPEYGYNSFFNKNHFVKTKLNIYLMKEAEISLT